jgi:hypothetical protein
MYAKNHNNQITQIERAIAEYTNVVEKFKIIMSKLYDKRLDLKEDEYKILKEDEHKNVSIVERALLSRADCYKLLKK